MNALDGPPRPSLYSAIFMLLSVCNGKVPILLTTLAGSHGLVRRVTGKPDLHCETVLRHHNVISSDDLFRWLERHVDIVAHRLGHLLRGVVKHLEADNLKPTIGRTEVADADKPARVGKQSVEHL